MYNNLKSRFLSLIFVIFGISILTFILIRSMNGNPAKIVLGSNENTVPKEAIEYVEQQLGLDEPIHIQYLNWIKRIIRFDFGRSFITDTPVLDELLYRFPITFFLAMVSIFVALIISFPLGVILALNKDSILSRFIHSVSMIFISIPSFLIALGLIYIFSVRLKFFPVITDKNYILPIISYVLPLASTYTIMIESSINKVIEEEYIITAQVKGLNTFEIVNKHIIKNSLLPILPLIGMNISSLLGGSFIIESIFLIPGIGKYAIDSIFLNDYPVIQAYTVFLSIFIVFINFFIDILYTIVDPRMKVNK